MLDQVKIWLTIIIIINLISDGTTAIVWTNCSDTNLQAANAQCGFVSVPWNYKRPQGEQLRVAVARILHTSSEADYQGVMLVRVGGPKGLTSVQRRLKFPADVAATYDWVSFDDRGAGATGPNMSCIPDFYPAPPVSQVPTTDALEKHWLNRSKTYVDACVKRHGSILRHLSSINVARDIERIRRAIGAPKLHIYSSGFGTYIVQLYATLHSNRVGKMIMDTFWNTERLRYQRVLDTNRGTERVLNLWFDWVAKYDNVYHLGNRSCEVRALWNDALGRTAKNPPGGWVGPLEWSGLLTFLNLGTAYWTLVTPTLASFMIDNNGTAAADISIRGTDELEALVLANTCNDERWTKNWDKVKTDYWRSYAQAPLYSWSQCWYSTPCIYWPYQSEEPIKANGSGVGDVLLIFETRAFGYREENAMQVRKVFPGARFVSVKDGIGSSNALTGNKCVDDVIVAFVRNGSIPARLPGDVADVVCSSPPFPIPEVV